MPVSNRAGRTRRHDRTGFLAMITFLGISGHELDATDAEVVAECLAVADGGVSEGELAVWIRQHVAKRR